MLGMENCAKREEDHEHDAWMTSSFLLYDHSLEYVAIHCPGP